MRLTRLSRSSFLPTHVANTTHAIPQQHAAGDSSPKRSTRIFEAITSLLLLVALTVTLLPLLPPTKSHVTLFTISPIGETRSNDTTSTIPEVLNITLLNNVTAAVSESAALLGNGTTSANLNVSELVSEVLWEGEAGVTVMVGVTDICSRRSSDVAMFCTSASDAGYHAAFLPLSLGWTLFALPTSPPGPILLLVTATAIILSLLTLVLPLLPLRKAFESFKNAMCLDSSRQRRLAEDDSDSVRNLVMKESPAVDQEAGKQTKLNVAFSVLGFAAFVLATVSAGLELKDIRNAWDAWNTVDAEKVGLKWKLGAGSYILAVLPCVMLLAFGAGCGPSFLRYMRDSRSRATSDAPEVAPFRDPVRGDGSVRPTLAIQPAIEVETEHWSRVSLDKLRTLPPVVETKAESRKSWRKSWRSIIGIGVAA